MTWAEHELGEASLGDARLSRRLVKLATRLAEMQLKSGDGKRALRTIERTWALAPHPDLAALYVRASGENDPLKRIAIVRRLADQKPDDLESHLALAQGDEVALDAVDDLLQPLHRNRALLARAAEALEQLPPLVVLPPAVLLDDHVRDFVNAFVTCKSPLAIQTLPPPADGVAFLGQAGFHHLRFQMTAKRALHA